MFKQAQKVIAGVAVLAAVAIGASAVAGADSNKSGSGSSFQSGSAAPSHNGMPPGGHGPGEKLLTGDTADKVEKAAQDKVPGGTILRVETDSDGSPYEAHVRKSNGSEVVVKVNKDFEATDLQSGPGGPPGGRGPNGSGTGATAGPPPTSSY